MTISTSVRVGSDGNIIIAVGKDDAGRMVRVTIERLSSDLPSKRLNGDEWSAMLQNTAGKWEGEFPEIDDPPPQERDDF